MGCIFWNLPSPDRLLLDDIDAIIVAVFERDQFLSICSLADSLDIAPSTVNHHLTNVLHFKLLHLRWIPCGLTNKFCAKRVTKAKEHFDLIDAQKRIGYRDII
jgi:hypothetical protein